MKQASLWGLLATYESLLHTSQTRAYFREPRKADISPFSKFLCRNAIVFDTFNEVVVSSKYRSDHTL